MLEKILQESFSRTKPIPPVNSRKIVEKNLLGILRAIFRVISPVVTPGKLSKIPTGIPSGEPTKIDFKVFGEICSGVFLKIPQEVQR